MIVKNPQLKLSFLIVFTVLIFCNCSAQDFTLSVLNFETCNKRDFNPDYRSYCSRDSNSFERNAVLASFVADYSHAYYYASRRKSIPEKQFDGLTTMQSETMKSMLLKQCGDDNVNADERQMACKMLEVLSRPNDVAALFGAYQSTNAKTYIVDHAVNYNAVLINEAHYSGQHRAFTSSLLKPLWEKGFRYLAIETLDVHDSLTQIRQYPSISTGYYSRELAYADFIRNALNIGYTLVSYEADVSDENKRDSLQALAIYEKTFKKDRNAKVVVHAGYSHIAETGDRNWQPMGSCLKRLLGRNLFTVDQVSMIAYHEAFKRNPYYQYASNERKISEPVVFKNTSGVCLVDPINAFSIDCQVYHPEMTYSAGHPDFLFDADKKLYALPQKLNAYTGHLLQINILSEDETAIPIERVILNGAGTRALLKPGKYAGYLIDQDGTAVLKFEILAN